MRLLDDERGQSVQVGAAILLGFVVIAITMYQVEVVADQNAEVEFNHQQDVRQDMIDLRNSISNAGTTGESEATSVKLGARYPARTIFVNPPPTRGILDSEPAGNVSLDNADVEGAYAGDGNPDSLVSSAHQTSRLVYQPRYSEFDGAGNLTIEHSLPFASFDSGFSDPLTSQPVVDGRSLTLTMLRGNLSEQGVDARSVDPRTVSRTTDTITVSPQDQNDPIVLTLPTKTPAVWNETIGTNYTTGEPQARVESWDPTAGEIQVFLDRSEYDLRMAAVGVGTGVQETDRYDIRRDGGGAYTLRWTNPESENSGVALSDCDSESCTWDVGASSSDSLTLNATLSTAFEGINLDYAISNDSVVSLDQESGMTNSDGANTTSITANESGSVEVLTTSNDGSDVITLTVENVGGIGNRAPSPSIDGVTDNSQDCNRNPQGSCVGGTSPTAEFVVDWSASDPDANLDQVTVELIAPDNSVADSAVYNYGGVGSVSDTTTLVDDPGQWNVDYTIRVTASDGTLSETATRTETADGI